MSKLLLLLAPALALAVLAAHFFRAGTWWLAAGCGVLVLLLALPRPWVARLVQLCLLAGTAEWVWALFGLAQQRLALGQPGCAWLSSRHGRVADRCFGAGVSQPAPQGALPAAVTMSPVRGLPCC